MSRLSSHAGYLLLRDQTRGFSLQRRGKSVAAVSSSPSFLVAECVLRVGYADGHQMPLLRKALRSQVFYVEAQEHVQIQRQTQSQI